MVQSRIKPAIVECQQGGLMVIAISLERGAEHP
jgi:hypothetical protein